MEEDLVFDCLVRPPILKHVATIGKTKKEVDGRRFDGMLECLG